MGELLQAAAAFPTVVYTVLLGIALVYWLFVILGALDIDILGGEADVDLGDLAIDGAGEAAGEALGGIGHGDIGHGDLGDVGHVHGDVGHVHADVGHAHGAEGGFAGALSALGLRKVPVTVALTSVLLVGWVVCLLSMHYLANVSGGVVLTWVIGPGVFVGALIVATLVAAVMVRPLAPVFETHVAKTRADYVGSVCEISTGRVDADFGQAKIEDGGTVLVVPVRCDRADAKLGRGDRALVIDYDDTRQAYVVEPYENVLGEKSGS